MDKRTFTENTVTSAYEDRCCQALATAIAAKARGSSIVRGGRDASVTAHKTARHDAGYERFFVKDEVKDISCISPGIHRTLHPKLKLETLTVNFSFKISETTDILEVGFAPSKLFLRSFWNGFYK
jgi:hypothetical protein